mgnify:CR=1 FL=1
MDTFASNNKYFSCPPRMNDGRHFTDYVSNKKMNLMLGQKARMGTIPDNHQYRQFLIRKTPNLIRSQRKFAVRKNGCRQGAMTHDGTWVSPCAMSGLVLPEKNSQNCTISGCSLQEIDADGLGVGRNVLNYKESIQTGKQSNHKKGAKRKFHCGYQPEDAFNYYGYQNKSNQHLRPTNGGGEALTGGDKIAMKQ